MFQLQRTLKSGRLYFLPVPITEKRARFIAINWLRKVVFKNNKNDLTLAYY